MHYPHAGHISLLLPNGSVLITGGTSPYSELYNVKTNRWRIAGRPGPRVFPAAAIVGRSEVLIAGGTSMSHKCLASAQLYVGGRWQATPSMESARCAPIGTRLPNGRAVVGGGFDGATLSTLQEFDPASRTWRPFPSLPSPRAGGSLSYLDGYLLAAGGTFEGSELKTSELRKL
jgi:hypothetical protein